MLHTNETIKMWKSKIQPMACTMFNALTREKQYEF